MNEEPITHDQAREFANKIVGLLSITDAFLLKDYIAQQERETRRLDLLDEQALSITYAKGGSSLLSELDITVTPVRQAIDAAMQPHTP